MCCQLKHDCAFQHPQCVDEISIHLFCKHCVKHCFVLHSHTRGGFWFHSASQQTSSVSASSLSLISADSCSCSVGEFLVPRVDAAFPLLTLWEQGAGPVRWFSSETIMCWFTVRGRADYSHCFLLTGKWLSGLPRGGSVWETDGWCERWRYLRFFALNVRQ